MMHNSPYRIFGWTIAACHGVPAITMISAALVVGVLLFELSSQYIKPVELSAIWVEPRTISVKDILAQTDDHAAVKLHKSGRWNRLCNVTASQTFSDERASTVLYGEDHDVDTPPRTGTFSNKARDLQIPKMLATSPGTWKIRIDNEGNCWPLERFFPIGGMKAEATFEIVP